MADVLFHAEFSSADASALSEPASRFTLYQNGKTTTLTLAATDVCVVCDLIVRVGASGLTVNIYDGADNSPDPGEKIFSGAMAANTGDDGLPGFAHFCQPGTYPKVKTSAAGQIDVIARGYIRTPA